MIWIAAYLAFNAIVFAGLWFRPTSRRAFIIARRMVRL